MTLRSQDRRVTLTYTLPQGLHDEIEREAAEHGMNRSRYLENLIRAGREAAGHAGNRKPSGEGGAARGA